MSQESLNAVIGFLLPVLIAFLKREHFPNAWNAFIAIAVYLVAGIGAVAISGQSFDLNNIVPSVAIFTASGTVAYQLFWKNLETSAT